MSQLLDEIKAAYQSLGLKPIQSLFFFRHEGTDYACPLVAVALARGHFDRSDPAIAIDGGANTALEWAAAQWGEAFVIGFLDGFDGRAPSKADPDYLAGHSLGVAAERELSPKAP